MRLVGTAELPTATPVRATGRWRSSPNAGRNTDWPGNAYYAGFMLVDSVEVVEDGSNRAPFWLRLRGAIDARLERIFPEHLALVEGLLLGRREYIDPVVTDRYTRSGLTHLLAISGTHVALLAAALLLVGAVVRVSRRTAVCSTLLLTWLYLLVIGAPPSAVRAGIMITLALFAFLLQRPTAPSAIVAGAALGILAFDPLAILDIGFQLSFAGILGIMLLRAPLLAIAPDQLQANGIVRGLMDAFVMGIGAFLVTAPIVAHHFQVIAPISIVSGVPAIPLTSLGLIGVASALLFEPIFPPIAALLASGTGAALDLLDWIAAISADVPFGNGPVSRPPWWSWTAAAGTGLGIAQLVRSGGRRLRWISGVGATIATLVVWPLLIPGGPDRLEVHFLDVGQGDAIAIRSPRNRWILVDAGPAGNGFDAGEQRVVPFLRERGARRLEALVLTHPDMDHIGGAGAVLTAIPVNVVFEPGLAVGKNIYVDLLDAVEVQGADWRAARSGRSLELDGVRFDFLWPDPEPIDDTADANQISAVMRVTYGAFGMLLTGDVGTEVETLLADRHREFLRSPVLKLGHHGSATSTAEAFLDAVRPEVAVVSAGRRNRYGHPAPSVMDRLRSRGIPVARTDEEGTVSFRISEDGTSWRRLD